MIKFTKITCYPSLKVKDKYPPDMCGCSECGWSGKISECEWEMESEGWEYPPYRVDYCPKCEDGGCIDDYYNEEWYKESLRTGNRKEESDEKM